MLVTTINAAELRWIANHSRFPKNPCSIRVSSVAKNNHLDRTPKYFDVRFGALMAK